MTKEGQLKKSGFYYETDTSLTFDERIQEIQDNPADNRYIYFDAQHFKGFGEQHLRNIHVLATLLENNNDFTALILRNIALNRDGAREIGGALGNNRYSMLTHMEVSNCNIGREGAASILVNILPEKSDYIPCSNFKAISLKGNNIGLGGCIEIVETILKSGAPVEYLDLSNNIILQNENDYYVKKDQLTKLAKKIAEIKTLRFLDISDNNLGAKGVVPFAETVSSNITRFYCRKNNIGFAGLSEFISKLSNKNQIVHLDLSYNHIGNVGAEFLEANFKFPQVTHINISLNGLDEIGFAAMSRIVKANTNIVALHKTSQFARFEPLDSVKGVLVKYSDKNANFSSRSGMKEESFPAHEEIEKILDKNREAAKNKENDKLLLHAIHIGNLAKVRELLEQGADITYTNELDENAFVTASRKRNIEVLKILKSHCIQHSFKIRDCLSDDSLNTALSYVIEDYEAVKLLMSLNNKVNSEVVNLAFAKRQIDIVAYFIQQKIDITQKTTLDDWVWLNLEFRNNKNRSEALDLLESSFFQAIKSKNIKEVIYFLGKFVHSNLLNKQEGETALNYAVKFSSVEITQILIERNSNKIEDLNAALNFADDFEKVKLLVKYGADIDQLENGKFQKERRELNISELRDQNKGWLKEQQSRELYEAVHDNNIGKVKLAISQGADLNFSDDIIAIKTLSLAFYKQNREIIDYLLAQQFDLKKALGSDGGDSLARVIKHDGRKLWGNLKSSDHAFTILNILQYYSPQFCEISSDYQEKYPFLWKGVIKSPSLLRSITSLSLSNTYSFELFDHLENLMGFKYDEKGAIDFYQIWRELSTKPFLEYLEIQINAIDPAKAFFQTYHSDSLVALSFSLKEKYPEKALRDVFKTFSQYQSLSVLVLEHQSIEDDLDAELLEEDILSLIGNNRNLLMLRGFSDQKSLYSFFGEDVEDVLNRNYEETKKLAEAGDARASYRLYAYYLANSDLDLAYSFLQSSAKLGYINAIYNLAVLYHTGEMSLGGLFNLSRKKLINKEEALKYFAQAAELGFLPAKVQLERIEMGKIKSIAGQEAEEKAAEEIQLEEDKEKIVDDLQDQKIEQKVDNSEIKESTEENKELSDSESFEEEVEKSESQSESDNLSIVSANDDNNDSLVTSSLLHKEKETELSKPFTGTELAKRITARILESRKDGFNAKINEIRAQRQQDSSSDTESSDSGSEYKNDSDDEELTMSSSDSDDGKLSQANPIGDNVFETSDAEDDFLESDDYTETEEESEVEEDKEKETAILYSRKEKQTKVNGGDNFSTEDRETLADLKSRISKVESDLNQLKLLTEELTEKYKIDNLLTSDDKSRIEKIIANYDNKKEIGEEELTQILKLVTLYRDNHIALKSDLADLYLADEDIGKCQEQRKFIADNEILNLYYRDCQKIMVGVLLSAQLLNKTNLGRNVILPQSFNISGNICESIMEELPFGRIAHAFTSGIVSDKLDNKFTVYWQKIMPLLQTGLAKDYELLIESFARKLTLALREDLIAKIENKPQSTLQSLSNKFAKVKHGLIGKSINTQKQNLTPEAEEDIQGLFYEIFSLKEESLEGLNKEQQRDRLFDLAINNRRNRKVSLTINELNPVKKTIPQTVNPFKISLLQEIQKRRKEDETAFSSEDVNREGLKVTNNGIRAQNPRVAISRTEVQVMAIGGLRKVDIKEINNQKLITEISRSDVDPNLSIINGLLNQGAKTNCRDKHGKTPLDIAVARHDIELVQLLLRYEGNEITNHTDANKIRSLEIKEALIEKGLIRKEKEQRDSKSNPMNDNSSSEESVSKIGDSAESSSNPSSQREQAEENLESKMAKQREEFEQKLREQQEEQAKTQQQQQQEFNKTLEEQQRKQREEFEQKLQEQQKQQEEQQRKFFEELKEKQKPQGCCGIQ